MLENVVYNGIKFDMLRLDELETKNGKGTKSFLAGEYAKKYPQGVVTSGSRNSVQVLSFARTFTKLNIPCIVCIPNGQDTDMIIELKKTNVIIKRITPAYNTVLNARARETATEKGYGHVPLGMLEDFAYDKNSLLVDKYVHILKNYKEIVVPVGSGTSLIGIVKGLKKNNLNINVIGVQTGMNAEKNIFKKAEEITKDYPITLKKSNEKYNNTLKNELDLNETYEAKCLPFIKENSLLWVVDK